MNASTKKQTPCPICKGKGTIIIPLANQLGVETKCGPCKGTGIKIKKRHS